MVTFVFGELRVFRFRAQDLSIFCKFEVVSRFKLVDCFDIRFSIMKIVISNLGLCLRNLCGRK